MFDNILGERTRDRGFAVKALINTGRSKDVWEEPTHLLLLLHYAISPYSALSPPLPLPR